MKAQLFKVVLAFGLLEAFLFQASISDTNSLTGGAYSKDLTSGVEADFLGLLQYTPSRVRQEIDLQSHGNNAVACDVKNADTGGSGQTINGFSGVYTFPSGESNEITSVTLLQSIEGSAVSGATASITSATEFSVTGFSLSPGNTYALVISTAFRSAGTTTLSLRTTFVP